jgi:hypothetical protein
MDNIQTVVSNEGKVKYIKIGNTTFKLVSYFSDKRTYEDIVKAAILREIQKKY